MTKYSTVVTVGLEGYDKEHLEEVRDSIELYIHQALDDWGAGDRFEAYSATGAVDAYEEEDYYRER